MRDQERTFLHDTWRLAKPYWSSEDRWWAWGLLIVLIMLNLGSVYISVRANTWYRDFFNAIQKFNWPAFKLQFIVFGILATAAISVAVTAPRPSPL